MVDGELRLEDEQQNYVCPYFPIENVGRRIPKCNSPHFKWIRLEWEEANDFCQSHNHIKCPLSSKFYLATPDEDIPAFVKREIPAYKELIRAKLAASK